MTKKSAELPELSLMESVDKLFLRFLVGKNKIYQEEEYNDGLSEAELDDNSSEEESELKQDGWNRRILLDVEKERVIDGSQVKAGDALIGLTPSGPHSNGYSLIRKVLERSGQSLSSQLDDKTLGEHLLAPTQIYVKSLLALHEKVNIHALSHITGGGLLENIPRVLPDNVNAVLAADSWQRPIIFDWLQEQGNIIDEEMYRTFNNGIGMVVCVDESDVEQTLSLLAGSGETAVRIGHIVAADNKTPQVLIQ